jgi:hypothetical protein
MPQFYQEASTDPGTSQIQSLPLTTLSAFDIPRPESIV